MKNQDGGEIRHIRLGFETVSWQHAAHIQQEATSSLYSGLQKYSEWCMVNLALKKRTERSLSFSLRPYIAILMMFDCVCSEYPDPDYLHYRW